MRTLTLVVLSVATFATQSPVVREGLRSMAVPDTAPRVGERAEVCGRAVVMTCTSRLPRIQIDVDGHASDLVVALSDSVKDEVAASFDERYLRREVCAEGPYATFGASNGVRISEASAIRVLAPPDVTIPLFSASVSPCATDVTMPTLVRSVNPQYTSEAMRAGIQGFVLIEAIVQTDGAVTEARVLRSLDRLFGLDEQAIQSAKQWRFNPGTRAGAPVPVRITLESHFVLRP